MRQTLTIAVAQPASVLYDVDFNMQRHAEAIKEAEARVVVFPELSITGYAIDVRPIDPNDERLAPIVRACDELGTVALVGAPTLGVAGATHISMLRVNGDGVSCVYNKIWLGGEEPISFSPGACARVITVDGWRLGLAICKDTGIEEHASATAALGMDVYVAGVCETEDDRHVQPSRAARVIQDHRVWVATASFAGATGGGFTETAGRSAIWRADGTPATELDREPGQVASTTLQRPGVV